MSEIKNVEAGYVSEQVYFYSDGLRLSGLFTKARGPSAGFKNPTIVCLHGYTGRKEIYMPGYIRELTLAGFNTLDFYHRGFGDSGGIKLKNKPWDQVEDINSAVIYLTQRADVDSDRIGLYGTSFGGTTGMMAAAHIQQIKCAASVGSSSNCKRSAHDKRTYSDRLDWEELLKEDRIRRVMTGTSKLVPYNDLIPSGRTELDSIDTMYKVAEKYPEGYPIENYDHYYKFSPEEYVHLISPRPVLFVHMARDTIVSVNEALNFYKHALEPKKLTIVPDANHVDVYEPRNPKVFKVVVGHLIEFFNLHLR